MYALIKNYSLFNESTGLFTAAFTDWNITVIKAIQAEIIAAKKNIDRFLST